MIHLIYLCFVSYSTGERLCALSKAAKCISESDIIDRVIRTTGAWTLLNEQVSCLFPLKERWILVF